MRRFFGKLFNRIRQGNKVRAASRVPRRASLRLEGLEDRLVMATATQLHAINHTTIPANAVASATQLHAINHTATTANFVARASLVNGVLTITNVVPGNAATLVFQCNPNNNSEMDVWETTDFFTPTEIFHGNKQSIPTVNIQLTSDDIVAVDDGNGMPLGQALSLSGTGTGNSLFLEGGRTVSGNETYVAESGSEAQVFVDNDTISLTNTITTILDTLPITGTDDLLVTGTKISLTDTVPNGQSLTLTGLSPGAGGTLEVADKPTVELEEYAANATIHLNSAFIPADHITVFDVNMHGAGDSTIIASTASNLQTEVQTDIAPVANQASVTLQGNSGPVVVNGNSSTPMTIGQQLSNGLFLTQGIQGKVTVQGLASLSVLDNGNTSTTENVTVTEKSISGTGLFGKNGILSYGGVANLNISTGQLADQYTVESSAQNAQFHTQISITDFSKAFFRADVFVDVFTEVILSLVNTSFGSATELFIHTSVDATVSDPGPPQGTVDVVNFGFLLSAEVTYNGFTPVVKQS